MGFQSGRRQVFVAVVVDGFSGFGVDVAEYGHFFIGGVGFGRGLWLLFVVGFPVMFEEAVFALEAAFGGGEVAQDEVVSLDFEGLPGAHGGTAVAIEVEVVFFWHAQAVPFGLGGFEDEGVEQGGFAWILVGFEPGLEEFEPVGFAFMVP